MVQQETNKLNKTNLAARVPDEGAFPALDGCGVPEAYVTPETGRDDEKQKPCAQDGVGQDVYQSCSSEGV